MKQHRNAAVRIEQDFNVKKDKHVSLLDGIKNMMRSGYEYLDLDEVLEFFSIKGPSKNDFTVEFEKVYDLGSTS